MAEIKKDCFAYSNTVKETCTALRQLYCAKEKCGFYKTKEQHEKEEKRQRESESL